MTPLYPWFYKRCLRNLLVGTALSILPAGAFYLFVFNYTPRQMAILGALALVDLAIFLPLDISILRLLFRPIERAFAEDATETELRLAMARLLDSPWLVIIRIFGPHAIAASAGISVLVWIADRYWWLGVPVSNFPVYWFLNLTVIPIAHAIYEFTAMEQVTQPLARELFIRLQKQHPASRLHGVQQLGRNFTLQARMRIFFPLLCFAPIVIVSFTAVKAAAKYSGVNTAPILRDVVLIGVSSALLFLYLMYKLGSQIRDQTSQLISSLDRIASGELSSRIDLYSTSEFGQIANHVNGMAVALAERQRLRDLFGSYMTPAVAANLLERGDGDRTEKRYVAIMFVDLRGFTAFSRSRTPELVVSTLNSFLEEAVPAIHAHQGTVNKYLGDGLLAIFGAPRHLPDPCAAAVAAALEISQRLRALNSLWVAAATPVLQIGIGIHAGEVVVGTIGAAEHKLEYTVIGDAVNVAARIEQLTKNLEAEILISISEEVYSHLPEAMRTAAGPSACEQVKGIAEPIKVFPVKATSPVPRQS